MARPFKRSPFFSCVFSLSPFAVSFHFLSGLCTPSLVSELPLLLHFLALVLPLLYGFLLFTCMPLSFSLCLPRPPSFSRVISLSYVCPSLYVCVPPLFVSDSFSREIRDAYLAPLFPTSAVYSAELHRATMASP